MNLVDHCFIHEIKLAIVYIDLVEFHHWRDSWKDLVNFDHPRCPFNGPLHYDVESMWCLRLLNISY
jgi:hypothetical protein